MEADSEHNHSQSNRLFLSKRNSCFQVENTGNKVLVVKLQLFFFSFFLKGLLFQTLHCLLVCIHEILPVDSRGAREPEDPQQAA